MASSGEMDVVRKFRDRLRSLPDEDAKLQACAEIRDDLLDQHSKLLCLFEQLEHVMLTECTRYKELKRGRTTSKNKSADADRWAQFVSIADESTQMRKPERLAPITKASGFWGVDKIKHYRFANEGWKYCKNLGTTATRNPSWEQFRTKQNQITLANKHCKDSINPISLSNLMIIQNWPHRQDHRMKRGSDFVILKYQRVSTSDLPAEYAFDTYGLVVLRKFIDAEQLSAESATCSIVTQTIRLASEERSSVQDADCLPSPPLRPQSGIQVARLSASFSPISMLSLRTTASPTPVQCPEMNEAPSNKPPSGEDTSPACLNTVPSTKPSIQIQSPASTDTNKAWNNPQLIGSDAFAALIRKSHRLSNVSRPTYVCIPPKMRAHRARPERRSTQVGKTVRGLDAEQCNCLIKVSKKFLQAIEGSQRMSSMEDITKYLHEGAQQDLLCLYHLRMYATWARESMLKQCARQSLLLQIPACLTPDLQEDAWRTIASKRRRLSLPVSSYDALALFEGPPLKRSRDMNSQIRHETGIGAKLPHATSTEDDTTRTPTMESNDLDLRRHLSTTYRADICDTAYQAVSCSVPANIVSAFDDFRRQYLIDTETSIAQSRLEVQKMIDEFVKLPKDSRLREELPLYYEILRSAVAPRILSYAELSSLRDVPSNAILIATMEEAVQVLMKGPLRIPILVPSQFREDFIHKTSINTFLEEHHMGHWIVVQDYARPIAKGDVRRMQKAEFTEKYFNHQHYPLNCLDLAGTTLNPDPPCYLRIPSLHLLRKVATGGYGGKMHHMRNNDLGASQAFMLLAKAGAWSMPHIDRSGVLSSIEGIEGRKLWLTWTGLTIEELKAYDESAADAPRAYLKAPPSRSNDEAFTEWQQDYMSAPRTRPIAPLISAGDLYLQPSGTLHSPYSPSNVLMHGTMHWDSRDIERIMQLAMLETHHRTITNEDEPNDFYHLMQRAIYKMRDDKTGTGSGGFEWPQSNGKRRSEELFEEWQNCHKSGESWKSLLRGCECRGECVKCACVLNELRCTLRCHRRDTGIRCLNR